MFHESNSNLNTSNDCIVALQALLEIKNKVLPEDTSKKDYAKKENDITVQERFSQIPPSRSAAHAQYSQSPQRTPLRHGTIGRNLTNSVPVASVKPSAIMRDIGSPVTIEANKNMAGTPADPTGNYQSLNFCTVSQMSSPVIELLNPTSTISTSVLDRDATNANSEGISCHPSAISAADLEGDDHTDKIQVALQSQPQRGKKRDDLSLTERLELTRTRNREHAKTTRIRKKARHQELCEREVEWQKFNSKVILDTARKRCIAEFIQFRFQQQLYREINLNCQSMNNGEATHEQSFDDSSNHLAAPKKSYTDAIESVNEQNQWQFVEKKEIPDSEDAILDTLPSWRNFVSNDQELFSSGDSLFVNALFFKGKSDFVFRSALDFVHGESGDRMPE